MTSKLLFKDWKLGDTEEEFTVMRVIVEGLEDGQQKTYTYDLLDRYDPETQTSSMARTTGYTCTGAANLVLSGKYTRKGISPPEFIGEAGLLHEMLDYLKERGVIYKLSVT